MSRVFFATALGMCVAIVAPARAEAQRGGGRSGPPPGVLVNPQPAKPTVGFGTLNRNDGRGRDGDRHRDRGARSPLVRSGFGSTFLLGSTLAQPQVVPVPTPVPYPVPYYYRMRARRPANESVGPAVPYDPAKSKTLIIGAGTDGGGGVMRIQQLGDSVLKLTWRGSDRPIREARFFLADSLRQPLLSQVVTAATPSAQFSIRDLGQELFAGLTTVFANGATVTNLVPLHAKPK